MCFSAGASFAASAVLMVVGTACIIKAARPSHLMFAGIPFIFGIQQLAEGVLWLSLKTDAHWRLSILASETFILFAQVIWPMWVPIAIMIFEKNKTRRLIQRLLVVIGITIGSYLGYLLFAYGAEAAIVGHHITYIQPYLSSNKAFVVSFYALATIVPPFFSHIKHMWLLGLLVMISYVIAAIFYQHFVLSVWCFFSSIISLSVYFIVAESRRTASSKISRTL